MADSIWLEFSHILPSKVLSLDNKKKYLRFLFVLYTLIRTFAPVFRKLAIFLCLLLGALGHCLASEDSIRVTLITCSPGQEVYQLYGHTAIRIKTPSDSQTPSNSPLKGEDTKQEASPLGGGLEGSVDIVFNYGVFDMSKPHFAWHFVLGHTDYMVQAIPWEYFVKDYEVRGSSITEQELNLTQAEAERLTRRLIENCLPENCNYRYSFLYKNCTTMVRDIVEQTVFGNIIYPDTLPHETAREILHHYTKEHPWAQEGNDLLLGAEVDTIMSEHSAMFIPENMMQAFEGAIICNTKGDQRPLVRSKKILLEAKPQVVEEEFPLLPWQAMLAFGGLCLFIMLIEIWCRRIFWLWDVLLLFLQGLAGTLLSFMFFFSEHPAVDSNWQILLLNPVAFVGIPLVIKAAIKHKRTLWYAFYFVVLALFLLFSPWIPQVFAKITVPLALCLLTRPISYYFVKGKKDPPAPVRGSNVTNGKKKNKR